MGGALVGTLSLPNPAITNPVGIGYTFDITDNNTYQHTKYTSVAITPDSNGNFNLCSLTPAISNTALPVTYATGPAGPTGATGPNGQAATIAIGNVNTLTPGSNATVSNSGTNSAAVFNFGIPQGATGATGPTGATGATGQAATINVGTVTTLSPGSSATVSNSGSSSSAVFNFGIPQGSTGATGPQGATGPTGSQGTTGATGATGPAGPPVTFMGAYNPATTYAAGQAVSYSGSSYASLISNNTGNQPNTSTADWGLLAAQGAAGVASLPNIAGVLNKLPRGLNLLNAAAVTAGYYANSPDGTLVSSNGFWVSDYIPANSGGQMVSSLPVHTEVAGLAFYDQNLTYVSGFGSIAAGTPFSVPSNAAFVRITPSAPGDGTFASNPQQSDINGWMVVWGTSLPSSYVGFALATQSQLSAQLVETVGIAPYIPTGVNFLNPAAVTQGYYLNEPDGTTVAASGLMVSDYMLANAGGQMTSNLGVHVGVSGGAFYDINKNYISGVENVANNVPFNVPSNAVYFRLTPGMQSGSDVTDPSNWMVVWGSTIPANYVPFRPTQASVSPADGSRMGVIGDSISAIFSNAWQNVVLSRLGVSLTFQDARPGRMWSQAFENFGDPSPGGTLSTYNSSYVYPGCSSNCGVAANYPEVGEASGSTFASDIADVDFLVIRLGTNDENYAVGSLGDATSSGTLYGNMAWVVQTILAANPLVRILMVGPELNSQASLANIQAVDAAEQTFANAYAIPYLSLLKVSGNNSFTTSTYTRDGIHPSDWAFTHVDGPAIAQFIQQWR